MRNGLLRAYQQIQEQLSLIEELPDVELFPVAPGEAPLPSMYFFWDQESLTFDGGDTKWINPLNVRAFFKVWLNVKGDNAVDALTTLIIDVQLIKDAVTAATTNALNWKGNVTKVIPAYGTEPKYWAGAEITIEIGEYL